MLTSDGLSRHQFLPLWRDAMEVPDTTERARLTLELGRATVREDGKAAPLMVAVSPQRDPVFVVVPLADAPRRGADLARQAIQRRLVEIEATEVYLLVTMQGGAGPIPSYLLAVWGERVGGEEVCVMRPYRWLDDGSLEEADMLKAPSPSDTVLSQELGGLLVPHH